MNWSKELYDKAWQFASQAHQGQKYGGREKGVKVEYIKHIEDVAKEVIETLSHAPEMNGDLAIQCALLHDVIEDTSYTYEDIKQQFGIDVADGVMALTKDHVLPSKEEQMRDSLERIKQQPYEVWMVKLADRIVNLYHPPYYWNEEKIFAYREEALIIHYELKEAHRPLADRLWEKIDKYRLFARKPFPKSELTPEELDAFESINHYYYPYCSGLWVKAFDLNDLSSSLYLYLSEIIIYNRVAKYTDISDTPMPDIQAMIETIVDHELTLYIDESIMYFYITNKPFNPITIDQAKQMYEDLWFLTDKEEPDYSDNYRTVYKFLFESEVGKQMRFYSNYSPWRKGSTQAIDFPQYFRDLAKEHPFMYERYLFYSEDELRMEGHYHSEEQTGSSSMYPAVVGIKDNLFVIFWTNQ